MKRFWLITLLLFFSNLFHAQEPDSLKALIFQSFEKSDFQTAIMYAKKAEAYYQKDGDTLNMAGCYNTLGSAYQRLGQYDEALHYYNLCSELMDEMGGEMAAVNKRYVLNNIAVIYLTMGESDMAEEMYRKCIALLGDPGNDTLANLDLATYYQNLSEVRLKQATAMGEEAPEYQKTFVEAVDYAKQALSLSRRYQDSDRKIIHRLLAYSQAVYESGQEAEALAVIDTALNIAQQGGEKYLETAIYLVKGEFAFRKGRNNAAVSFYDVAIEKAKENHFDEYCLEGLEGAYLASRSSNPARAVAYLEQFVALKDSVYNMEQQTMIRDFQVKYQMAEKENQLSVQEDKNRQERRLLTLVVVIALLFFAFSVVLLRLVFVRKKQNEMLSRRNKTQKHLFSVVSHDIKTPVLVQENMLDLMLSHYDEMDSNQLRETLSALMSSTQMLKDKMQNIMQWVKDEVGDNPMQITRFNLRELTESALKTHSWSLKAKSLKVFNEIPDDWWCLDDSKVVEMVLQNLFSNAVKFSFANGEIRIQGVEEGQRYWVIVVDHGAGISKERLERLLKSITSSTEGTEGERGTGIGLFVSNQLLQRNGSEFHIESEEGKGTKVRFTVKKEI